VVRRTSEQVRRDLLEGARELFAQQGFADTTTRDIARHCGVHENLIFRHFGTKAALFQEAVAVPFDEFVRDWSRQWTSAANSDEVEQRMSRYLTGLYGRMMEQRELRLALFRSPPPVRDSTAREVFEPYFETLTAYADDSFRSTGWDDLDADLTVRMAFGMTLGLAVFDHLLFGEPATAGPRPAVTDQLSRLLVRGMAPRPAAKTAAGTSTTG
jgi:AcrR family transcriptional regulator